MLRLSFAFLLCGSSALGQTFTKPLQITSSRVPKDLKFRGDLAEAWQWNDKLGENILIATTIAPYQQKTSSEEAEEAAYAAELYAFHFVKKDTAFDLLWKLSDAERECPFDITAEFIKGALQVTDLDGDDIAETIVQYKLACRSDVSPAQMKLIMHEGTAKYALRGMMWLKSSEEDSFSVTENNVNLETWKEYKGAEDWEKLFGRYRSEKEFTTAPASFLKLARRQWLKHAKESFE